MGEKGNMAAGSGWPGAGSGGADLEQDLSDAKDPGSSGAPRLPDSKGGVAPDAKSRAGAAGRDAGVPGLPGVGSPPAPGSVGPVGEPPAPPDPGGTAFGGAVSGGRRDREDPPEAGAPGSGR